jgi:hypothetical protein
MIRDVIECWMGTQFMKLPRQAAFPESDAKAVRNSKEGVRIDGFPLDESLSRIV